ncbi:MAG: hypothetical protein IJX17_02175 [Clostridia bacterium]|nr:hypothetical protein [Clostridia bacterium]
MEVVVELGILLDGDLDYYQDLLEKAGAENEFNCETHDRYWTNKTYDELSKMTENQIKMSCIRVRDCNGIGGTKLKPKKGGLFKKVIYDVDNLFLYDNTRKKREKMDKKQWKELVSVIENNGWYEIFDTFKTDFQYVIGDMKSRIQLQEIDNIGLVLYYDNPDYYTMPADLQWKSLVDELNSYGFNLRHDEQGIDKLRTLLLGYDCYSYNQNG